MKHYCSIYFFVRWQNNFGKNYIYFSIAIVYTKNRCIFVYTKTINMETIKLYHATNIPIEEIGIEKQTMYFTGRFESAKNWGEEHYEDYDILEIEIPIEDIYEFTPERPMFAITDFEQLEVKPELITGKCVHFEDCSDGYIVKNINEYELK